MSNTRFYSAEKLNIGALISLSSSAATHATRALRMNVGDKLKLFNGDGLDYDCELISIKKNEVIAKVLACDNIENESPLDITLLQGISSGDRMDYTIQKAVELGVRAIQPISTERSVVKLNQERAQKRLEHWQNIVTSACEQSGRAFVPPIFPPASLLNWLAENPQGKATRILLNPIGALKIADLTKPNTHIQLLIGAEGGLSQSEINAATSQGFQSIILGPRILRTETAALTAIASMQILWGDY